jgi:hypothetical protein
MALRAGLGRTACRGCRALVYVLVHHRMVPEELAVLPNSAPDVEHGRISEEYSKLSCQARGEALVGLSSQFTNRKAEATSRPHAKPLAAQDACGPPPRFLKNLRSVPIGSTRLQRRTRIATKFQTFRVGFLDCHYETRTASSV